MKCVYILRGVSGSGKSTLAQELAKENGVICSADNYFINENKEYVSDVTKLKEAHSSCFAKFVNCLEGGVNKVIVDNTNTSEEEIQLYLKEALDYKYQVFSIVVENRHGNNSIHNVNNSTRQAQGFRIHNSLKLI